MKIDERTGLPELPKGYFWSVSEDEYTSHAQLAIRKRFGIISWTVTSSGIQAPFRRNSPYKDGRPIVGVPLLIDQVDDAALQYSAKRLYRTWRDELDLRAEREAARKKYVGDYPPKTLNNNESEQA